MPSSRRAVVLCSSALSVVLGACATTAARGRTATRSTPVEGTGGRCVPLRERAGREFGCFVIVDQPIGPLGAVPVFWHLDAYATRGAAEAARGPRGTVAESFGRVWLLNIEAAAWRPAAGERVATVGPLPVAPGVTYAAQYMEAVFRPGMRSTVHRHSGPEAWYTLTGETCLETPDTVMVGRAGGQYVIVPHGPPMELTATGAETRRALVLILHDAAQPATMEVPDWTPKGRCTRVAAP